MQLTYQTHHKTIFSQLLPLVLWLNHHSSCSYRWTLPPLPIKTMMPLPPTTSIWRGGVVASLVPINEVNTRWARLVLGWVTVSGFDSQSLEALYFGM